MVHSLDCKPLHFSSTEVYNDCGLCYSVVFLLAVEVENGNLSALPVVLGAILDPGGYCQWMASLERETTGHQWPGITAA